MAKVSDSQVSCLADMKDGDVAEILSWHSEAWGCCTKI